MNGHDERNDRPMRAAAAETDARAVRLARLERLAQRWLAAEATDAEERELREGIRTAGELPEPLRGIRMLLEGFEALAGERMPAAAEGDGLCRGAAGPVPAPASRMEDLRIPAPAFRAEGVPQAENLRSLSGRRNLRKGLRWGLALAAAAAVALGLLLGAELLRKPYCYIDGRAVYDREVAMQATVYFESLAALDTPNRLVDELIGTE